MIKLTTFLMAILLAIPSAYGMHNEKTLIIDNQTFGRIKMWVSTSSSRDSMSLRNPRGSKPHVFTLPKNSISKIKVIDKKSQTLGISFFTQDNLRARRYNLSYNTPYILKYAYSTKGKCRLEVQPAQRKNV